VQESISAVFASFELSVNIIVIYMKKKLDTILLAHVQFCLFF